MKCVILLFNFILSTCFGLIRYLNLQNNTISRKRTTIAIKWPLSRYRPLEYTNVGDEFSSGTRRKNNEWTESFEEEGKEKRDDRDERGRTALWRGSSVHRFEAGTKARSLRVHSVFVSLVNAKRNKPLGHVAYFRMGQLVRPEHGARYVKSGPRCRGKIAN